MIAPAKQGILTRDIPTVTRDELASDWRNAKECFDQALAQKTEADRVYVAAATRLNTIERQVKKLEKQDAHALREAAKSLRGTA